MTLPARARQRLYLPPGGEGAEQSEADEGAVQRKFCIFYGELVRQPLIRHA